MKTKSTRNGEITLSFTDIGKSCPGRKFLTSQICLLSLFVKIKFSRKISGLTVLYSPFKRLVQALLKCCSECLLEMEYTHKEALNVFYEQDND